MKREVSEQNNEPVLGIPVAYTIHIYLLLLRMGFVLLCAAI